MSKARLIELGGRVPLLGRGMRWWARRYPEGSVTEIRCGLAAGLRWKRHHRYVNGYWIGHYEMPLQEALGRELKPGDTFFDIGANAGFFTLMASRLVAESGRCVAFDPAPANVQSIREQIEVNALGNCIAVQKAVADRAGRAMFSFQGEGSAMGHLGASAGDERSTEVEVMTLDEAYEQFGRPSLIKVDVEGAEVRVIEGAAKVLREARPTWMIELHNRECDEGARRLLGKADYRLFDLNGEALGAGGDGERYVIARPR